MFFCFRFPRLLVCADGILLPPLVSVLSFVTQALCCRYDSTTLFLPCVLFSATYDAPGVSCLLLGCTALELTGFWRHCVYYVFCTSPWLLPTGYR